MIKIKGTDIYDEAPRRFENTGFVRIEIEGHDYLVRRAHFNDIREKRSKAVWEAYEIIEVGREFHLVHRTSEQNALRSLTYTIIKACSEKSQVSQLPVLEDRL